MYYIKRSKILWPKSHGRWSPWSWPNDWLPGHHCDIETEKVLYVHSHSAGHLSSCTQKNRKHLFTQSLSEKWVGYVAMKSSILLKDLIWNFTINTLLFQLNYIYFFRLGTKGWNWPIFVVWYIIAGLLEIWSLNELERESFLTESYLVIWRKEWLSTLHLSEEK